MVLRDASQLTGSVTIDIGGTAAEARLDSPLYDTTELQAFSQEVPPRVQRRRRVPVAGRRVLSASRPRLRPDLPTPGYDAITRATDRRGQRGLQRAARHAVLLRFELQLPAVRGVRRRHLPLHRRVGADRSVLRYYDFNEDRAADLRRLVRRRGLHQCAGLGGTRTASRRASSWRSTSNDDVQFTAQVSRGFRLGGINDPLNVRICTADDRALYGSDPRALGGREGVELRDRHEDAAGRRPRHLQRLGVLLGHRGPAGERRCRQLLLAHRRQRAEGADARRRKSSCSRGRTRTGTSGSRRTWVEAEIDRSITGTGTRRSPASARATGCRLARAAGGGERRRTTGQLVSASLDGYVRVHRAARGLLVHAARATRSRASARFDARLAAGSARFIAFGDPTIDQLHVRSRSCRRTRSATCASVCSTDSWEAALFVNNLWDERAFLSLDRERGRARASAISPTSRARSA